MRRFFAIFAVIVAPVGAAVVIGALLLFGVQPHAVFAPGHAMRWLLGVMGIHAPNAVGVLTTVAFWWLLFVIAGLAWERRHSSRAATTGKPRW